MRQGVYDLGHHGGCLLIARREPRFLVMTACEVWLLARPRETRAGEFDTRPKGALGAQQQIALHGVE